PNASAECGAASGIEDDAIEAGAGVGSEVGEVEGGVGGGKKTVQIGPLDITRQIGRILNLVELAGEHAPTELDRAVSQRHRIQLGLGHREDNDVVQAEEARIIAEAKRQDRAGEGGGGLELKVGPKGGADI